MDIIGNCSKKYDSSLPWIWIVEYLSGFKEVDIFILKGVCFLCFKVMYFKLGLLVLYVCLFNVM